jgi:hypothetical protein
MAVVLLALILLTLWFGSGAVLSGLGWFLVIWLAGALLIAIIGGIWESVQGCGHHQGAGTAAHAETVKERKRQPNFTRYKVMLDLLWQEEKQIAKCPSFSVVAKTKEQAISKAEAKAAQWAARWNYGEFKATSATLEWGDSDAHFRRDTDEEGWYAVCGSDLVLGKQVLWPPYDL